MKRWITNSLPAALLMVWPSSSQAGNYKNFNVAVYLRAYEVREAADLDQLQLRWGVLEKQLKADKGYLETHRVFSAQ